MRILDNIYFWLSSLLVIIIGVFCYFIWFYKPENLVSNDILHNSQKYHELVQIIESKSNEIPEGKLVSYHNIPMEIRQKLSELKFFDEPDYISVDKDSCNKIDISIQKQHWYLEYNGCGNNPFEGYIENGFIESWGINKHWSLFVDNDFI